MTNHAGDLGRQRAAPDHASRAPIPVLRLGTARRADGTFDQTFLAGLRTALHEIGFVQLTDYGATPGQIGELTAAAARFFDRLFLGPPAGRVPGHSAIAARIRRAGPRSQPVRP